MAIDARISELLTTVRLAHGPQDGTPEKIEAERSALSPGFQEYGSIRERIFGELVDLLEDEDPGHLAADAWKNAVASGGEAWNSTVAKAESAIPEATSTIFLWVQKAGVEEARFWQYLGQAVVAAEARDYIVRYREDVDQKADALEGKWEKLTEAHESFGVSEKAAIDEVEKAVEEALKLYNAFERDASEKTADVVRVATQVVGTLGGAAYTAVTGEPLPPDVSQAMSVAQETITKGAESFLGIHGEAAVRLERMRNAFRADRETVIVMFKDFRADAEEFVKVHGYAEVTNRMENARRALAEFNSSVGSTSGLKSDADALVGQLLPILQRQADNARNIWDVFVQRHEHKFFGAFSTDFRAALIGVDGGSWDPQFEAIVSQDLYALAQKWIDRPPDQIWNLDQTDIPEAWRNQLRERIKDSAARFVERQKQLAETFQPDALHKTMAGEYEITQEELDRFR